MLGMKILNSGFAQAMEFWKNYGILKRKFHIWKNYGIWAKRSDLWKNYGIFVLVEKSACFLKKMGGKYVRTSKCSLIFVASVITSQGLALRTSRAIIPLAYCSAEWIPARQFTLFVPQVGYDSKLSCRRIDLGDDYSLILGQDQSRSRCPRPHKVRA